MKIKNTLQALSLIPFITLGSISVAYGQISVSRSVIEFSKSAKVQDIEVVNKGENKVYLDLKVAQIINPESENAQRVELEDPRTSPVIVSPRQLLIPPGERRRMRVILRKGATDTDQVFRLAVKPYTGSVKVDDAGGDKKSSAIKVLVGYDLLLLSRPERLNPDMTVSRNSNSISFVNNGNTNVLLRKIEQCDVAANSCVELQPNRLYAGERYTIELPHQGSNEQYPINVWKAVGLDNEKLSF